MYVQEANIIAFGINARPAATATAKQTLREYQFKTIMAVRRVVEQTLLFFVSADDECVSTGHTPSEKMLCVVETLRSRNGKYVVLSNHHAQYKTDTGSATSLRTRCIHQVQCKLLFYRREIVCTVYIAKEFRGGRVPFRLPPCKWIVLNR